MTSQRLRALVIGLALLTQACEKGPPNREEVSAALVAEFPRHPHNPKVLMGYVSNEAGEPKGSGPGWESYQTAKKRLDALVAAGLLTPPQRNPQAWTRWNRTFYVWTSAPTATGASCVTPIESWKESGQMQVPMSQVATMVPQLIQVTGVTAPASSEDQEIAAEFAWRWSTTPCGQALQGLLDLQSDEPHTGDVTFRKYDDGWRIEGLNFHGFLM